MSGHRMIMGAAALAVAATCVAGATAGLQGMSGGSSYKSAGTFGKVGTGNGQFGGPLGIAVASNGSVYVADANNNRIEVFSAGGAYRDKWGSIGDGSGQFTFARDVTLAPDGTVWVADDNNSRAQQFSAGGVYKSSVSIGSESARGIAVDGDGNVLVAAEGGSTAGFRVFTGGAGGAGPLLGGGEYAIQDVEVSPDGTVFITTSATNASNARVRHYSVDGKSLGAFAIPNPTGIGIDPDCNVWAGDHPGRAITKYSPSGKKLATASSPDLQANDIAVAKNGDVYVTAQPGSVVHFKEDKAKPATANVPSKLKVVDGAVSVKYTASGFACPDQVSATATISGKGISGKASVQVAAGKATVIRIPVKAPSSATTSTFKIVLKTNGRPTTEAKQVTVSR